MFEGGKVKVVLIFYNKWKIGSLNSSTVLIQQLRLLLWKSQIAQLLFSAYFRPLTTTSLDMPNGHIETPK